ncbi:GH25 family lysozyme [Haloferula chungangensis]|uniref:GH25 family lysozyme n=1 Tax=Haloferula chungangensis TaxID=1048331 RepID=A0ABW2L8G3_9BACT
MKKLLLLLVVPLLCQCGGGFGGTSVKDSPAVLNVSGWDPKEVQRGGDRFSQHDVSAMRRNGALGLIARSAKGPLLDDKFSDFMASANREGLLLGAYHFVTLEQPAKLQAENFVSRVRSVARARGITGRKILLVGDFDTKSSPDRLVDFITRVEQLTGVTPVTYLENSAALRTSLNNASPSQKRVMRRSPFWLALYGPAGTERSMGGDLTPDELTRQYGVWDDWAMWQYGGVIWGNGRSQAKHYNTSSWRSPRYFGNMAHPMERNVFRGDLRDLQSFWNRHGLAL